jgi:hypothetical protein
MFTKNITVVLWLNFMKTLFIILTIM